MRNVDKEYSFSISRVNEFQWKEVAELFHQYRVWYGCSSDPTDIEKAGEFVRERLECGESVIYIASDQGKIIGFAQLYPLFSSLSMRRVWVLNDLFVLEQWRGQGVGKELLQAVEEYTVGTGAKGIQLQTAVDNVSARNLYEGAGYVLDREFLTYERILG